MNETKIISLER